MTWSVLICSFQQKITVFSGEYGWLDMWAVAVFDLVDWTWPLQYLLDMSVAYHAEQGTLHVVKTAKSDWQFTLILTVKIHTNMCAIWVLFSVQFTLSDVVMWLYNLYCVGALWNPPKLPYPLKLNLLCTVIIFLSLFHRSTTYSGTISTEVTKVCCESW